jgi:Fic family protein
MINPANKPAKILAQDRGEAPSLMEPLLVHESAKPWKKLADLALELAARASGFQRSLPPGVADALAHLVRSMNCYYSNLIEGHDTHPIDIERALKADFSHNPEQRDLQLEAQAHIEVQAWIDAGHFDGRAATTNGILELHRRFCEKLPGTLLMVHNEDTGQTLKVSPGQWRDRDVKVGRHIAISPVAVPRFMLRFEEAYTKLGRVDAIIAAATAHHRLLWIHPFLDGNGRVARLMSYAMLRDALNSGGLWSVARGLARQEQAYKKHLAEADLPRRNDLDGRGTLSEEALADFAEFFLVTSIDQVAFMETLMQPDRLRHRVQIWAEEEIRAGALPAKSTMVLEALLYRGELARGDVESLLGTSDRTARRITSALLDRGVLQSTSSRAPLRLAFPATLAARWLPGLFPEK